MTAYILLGLTFCAGFLAGYWWKFFSSAFHWLSFVRDDARWEEECREMRVLALRIARMLGR